MFTFPPRWSALVMNRQWTLPKGIHLRSRRTNTGSVHGQPLRSASERAIAAASPWFIYRCVRPTSWRSAASASNNRTGCYHASRRAGRAEGSACCSARKPAREAELLLSVAETALVSCNALVSRRPAVSGAVVSSAARWPEASPRTPEGSARVGKPFPLLGTRPKDD
jgi:hypothetical protein